DHWACTWPPSRYSPGDFGPRDNLSRYNVVGAVFDANDPALSARAEVRRIGTIDLALTRDATVNAGAGLGLRSLSSWLPDAAIDGDTVIGWKKVGAHVKTTDDRTAGLTVRSGDEQVAVLYLVNPAQDVMKSFAVCSMASRAPLAECGEGGAVCCDNSHCLHDL